MSNDPKELQEAAEQGDAEAQFRLGNCYATGSGVAQDLLQAIKWYRKAADRGYSKAKMCLEEFFQ